VTLTSQLPIPLNDAIANPTRPEFLGHGAKKDPLAGRITDAWVRFFSSLTQTIAVNPQTTRTVQLSGQKTSLAATAIPSSLLSLGLYQVAYYAAVSQAASVSSSLTVTIQWTDRGQTMSSVGPAITGNTLTTFQSGDLALIHCDGATTVTYATTYASVGATPMLYYLGVALIQVG